MNSEEFNKIFKNGDDVIYIDDAGNEHKTKTRSIAWDLASGSSVVAIVGRRGGHDIERIKAIHKLNQ